MSTQYVQFPNFGDVNTYANLAAFPASGGPGELGIALNSNILYYYDPSVPGWVALGASGTGSVTSVAATVPTFLSISGSPITTSGTLAITLSGTALPVLNGGTGVTSLGSLTDVGTDGITITGGTGVLISSASISQHVADATHNGYLSSADWNTFSGAATGTVTSVAATVPAFLSISGSPITTSGTLAISFSGTALPVANGGTGVTSLGNLTDVGTDGITVTGGTGALITSASISQHVADTTHSGYLSSSDWNTFSGKQAALTIGDFTDAGTDGIIVTNGVGSVIGTGTSIAQHVADTTHNGYLSSADWNTFNGKGSGTLTAISVVSANGLAGSSSGGATPALTLSTSITGILQGNGTAISAATTGNLTDVGTDGITITGGTGSVLGSGTSLSQHVADTTHNGYLSSTDWNTFNGKGAGTVTSVAATVPTFLSISGSPVTSSGTLAITLSGTALPVLNGGTGVTALGDLTDVGTDGITVTGGTGALITSASISQHVADTTHSGYLSSTDWNTFNGKGSGTVTSVAATVPTFLSVSGSPVTSSGTLAITLSGTALPIANGGTAVTSVTTSPTATSFAGWDANKNLSANSVIESYTTTATAAGTTTLVVGSTKQQFFTGTTTQTVVLPVTSTLVLGQQFIIQNNSTGNVTVESSGANTIQVMTANTNLVATVILTSGTTAASWSIAYSSLISASAAPSVQVFKTVTGSGTYNTSTSPRTPLYLVVDIVGPGGGGAGGGPTAGSGTAGSTSSFGTSLLSVNGGAGGTQGGPGGAGGAVGTFGGATIVFNVAGSAGSPGANASGLLQASGGDGGSSFFGGAGSGSAGFGGGSSAAALNSGSGGGGGSGSSTGSAGSGGGSGGYMRAIIYNPLSSYSFILSDGGALGAAGTGTGASAGSQGGSSIIVVTEYYQ